MNIGNGAFNMLSLLARGLSGADVEVQALAGGDTARAVITGNRILLPAAETGVQLRRAMVAHAVAHLRHSVPDRPASTLKPMGIAVVSAIEDARVERLLCRDFPGLHGWFVDSLLRAPDPLDLRFAALISRMNRLLMVPAWQDDNHWVNKARRLFDETVVTAGLEDYNAFRAIASVLANDLGQMRVRFEPQDYVVPERYRDDNSYLWNFANTADSPEEAIPVQQTRMAVQATSDSAGESSEAVENELEVGRYRYPEWDRKLERLRPEWCTVIEKRPAWQGMSPARGLATAVRESIRPIALPALRQISRAHRLRRQWEGDDIDLNAAIELMVDRRSQLQPDTRLFMRSGKCRRRASVLVLLDLSASVADIGTANTSLLDIEKQAALILAASKTRGFDRLAVHGFSSNTRSEVYYYRLLEFGQPLDQDSRALIEAVRGRYSTRMGAALRHATYQMRGEREGQRSIVVVTDGAPSDIDVHDDKYLIEDARQAVAQAREVGVHTACVAVDGEADAHLRRIFGWRNYCVAEDVASLPARLARLSARLAMVS